MQLQRDPSSLDPRENTGVGPYICKSAERWYQRILYRKEDGGHRFIEHRYPRAVGIEIHAKVAKDGRKRKKRKRIAPPNEGRRGRDTLTGRRCQSGGVRLLSGNETWIRKLCPGWGMSAFCPYDYVAARGESLSGGGSSVVEVKPIAGNSGRRGERGGGRGLVGETVKGENG